MGERSFVIARDDLVDLADLVDACSRLFPRNVR